MRRERGGILALLTPEGRFQGCPRPLLQGGNPEATVRGRLVSQVPYLPRTPVRWGCVLHLLLLGFLCSDGLREASIPCLLGFLAHADPLARPPCPGGG